MYQNKTISVVIPCHNEAESIGKVIKSLPKETDRVIVVDNNSSDNTAQIAKNAGAEVIFEPKQGYGRAYKTGLSKAEGEIIVTLDGDGQYPTEEIIGLIDFLIEKKINFISASRFPLSRSKSINLTRTIGNWLLTQMTNFLFKSKIKDSQSGMWVFKKEILSEFKLTSDGMPFSEEIKIRALVDPKIRFREKRIKYHQRIGQSKLFPLRDGFKNLVFLFRLRWELRKRIKSDFLPSLLVFLIFASLFSLIQFSSHNLSGVDAYYHIKYAYLYRTLGIEETLNNFSLAGEYSILKQYPTDLSFFYHILLIPLTYWNLIVGSKIAAIVFGSLVFALFYWILKRFKIRYSFWWTALFYAASSDFVFRLTLSRPFVLSVSALILGFYLIVRKKYISLLILSFFYALTYAVFPLILVMSFFYLLVEYFKTRKIDWKILLFPLLGISLAVIVRPDFPQNLIVVIFQDFFTFFYKIKGVSLSIGAEMYPINASLTENFILIFLFSFGLAFIPVNLILKRKSKGSLSIIRTYALLLSLFFFVLSLFSHRFIEYWTPFSLFLAAFALEEIKRDDRYCKNFGQKSKDILRGFFKPAKILLFFVFLLLIVFYGQTNTSIAIKSAKDSIPFDKYQRAGQWLKENTPEQSIIFNASWDTFPQLFFYNERNRYIIGKDPTFMFLYNQKLYWAWKNIGGLGIICDRDDKECPDPDEIKKNPLQEEKISRIINGVFQSRYIFIDNQPWQNDENLNQEESSKHHFLIKMIENSPYFEKVYQDQKYQEVMIYRVK